MRGLDPRSRELATRAGAALERRDAAAALPLLAAAFAANPAHPELLRLRAIALSAQGRDSEAVALLQEAAVQWSGDGLIAGNLGAVLAQLGEHDAALAEFQRATELDPTRIDAWLNLGRAYALRHDAAAALDAFTAVVERAPSHRQARVLRAEALRALGRIGDAEAELRTVLREDANAVSAWIGLDNLKATHGDDDLQALARLYAAHAGTAEQHIALGFALAHALEDRQRFDAAFALFSEVNALKRRGFTWSAAAASALVDDIIAAFPQPPPATGRGGERIFLVGLPRSGSTLAEQILAAHPRVTGGGETEEIARVLQEESRRRGQPFPQWVRAAEPADWARLGDRYLERTAPASGIPASSVTTDKTLPNWQVVGAILRMLPGARIVHCVRDPLETCWSCFKHNFAAGQFFAYAFDELAAFHRDADRAMRHWRAQAPAAVYTHVYEDLVARPEASVRALLAHCGLAFDAACLDFHEADREVHTTSAAQVRAPLHEARATAARYGARLDPLHQALDIRAVDTRASD